MRTPSELPEMLRHGPFTRRQAMELGVSARRLRAGDILRQGRGIYRWAGGEQGTVPDELAGDCSPVSFLQALQREYSDSWFSHTTAARLFGMELPSWLREHQEIHLSRVAVSTTTVRCPGVVPHAVVIEDGEVVERHGLRVSRPARIYFDLMGVLPEKELVAFGDHLVRIPRPQLEGRETPWETPRSLAQVLREHRKTKGIVTGRRALQQVRVGADSRMETFVRLALIEAGLPEPELQVPPEPGSPFTGDLGYSAAKVVIQYDGGMHFTAAQQARDQRRNFAFENAGWTVILVNSEDYRDNFRTLVRRIAMALAHQ